jgi:hypothetical protein
MNTGSGSFTVFETICRDLLARLIPDRSERGRAFVAEADALLVTLVQWKEVPPSREVRASVIAKVLDLHRRAMEHVTLSSHTHK